MIDQDLTRHAGEFKRYIDNHQYEVGPEGIYFPKAHAVGVGEYFYDTNDGERPGVSRNLLPVQAFNYLLETGLRAGAPKTSFYLALFSGAYTPVDSVTASNFASEATEITSNSNGYSEPSRQAWTPEAAAGGQMDNVNSRAAFTIATSSSVVIRGAALLSEPTKGSANGVLISISRFDQDRTEYNGNVFNLGYRVRLRQPL